MGPACAPCLGPSACGEGGGWQGFFLPSFPSALRPGLQPAGEDEFACLSCVDQSSVAASLGGYGGGQDLLGDLGIHANKAQSLRSRLIGNLEGAWRSWSSTYAGPEELFFLFLREGGFSQ